MEALLWDGDLWLSMLHGPLKAQDLFRDPRILVHGIVTDRDGDAGEYKLRGRAIPDHSRERQQAYADEVTERIGWTPEPGRFHLFRIDIADVTFIRYDEQTGDQFTARWPSNEAFVRRGTSATSLGPRQPTTSSSIPERSKTRRCSSRRSRRLGMITAWGGLGSAPSRPDPQTWGMTSHPGAMHRSPMAMKTASQRMD